MSNKPVPGQASAGCACSDLPTIKVSDIATDFSEFFVILSSGRLQMPCWIEIGDARHRVTRENYRDLARGMTLCLEVRSLFV